MGRQASSRWAGDGIGIADRSACRYTPAFGRAEGAVPALLAGSEPGPANSISICWRNGHQNPAHDDEAVIKGEPLEVDERTTANTDLAPLIVPFGKVLESLREFAYGLNEAGLTNARGNAWNATSVSAAGTRSGWL